MSANERQVAGSHYRAGVQHWDLMAYNRVGYFEAQITKYITRWKKKNGVQDVEKSIHYHEKLTELLTDGILSLPAESREAKFLEEFRASNDLGDVEYTIFSLLLTYTTMDELHRVGILLQHLLQMAQMAREKELATPKGIEHTFTIANTTQKQLGELRVLDWIFKRKK